MPLIADRYRLEREVGRGGMGEVWLAEDTVLGRQVALKRIGALPGTSEVDLDRVRREAQVSAMLSHEHVVAVFDLVTHEDRSWLVMEYVASENLAHLVQRRGGLSPDETADLIRQAASALAAAHRAGIVHRDVKPSNLLVTPGGHVKLGDFGIARLAQDQTLTKTGLLVGSPGFIAPEVAAGAAATSASDLWSLGATAFHAVEGHSPYATVDGNLIGTLYQIVNEPAPVPQHAGWLGTLLEHLMVHDPSRRWTADEVVDFLAAGPDASHTRVLPAIPTAPVLPPAAAPRPTPPRRLRSRRSRVPAPVLAGLGVLAVLVVALALLVVPQLRGGRAGDASRQSTSSPAAPGGAGMRRFVEGYLATAPTNARRAFAELTPAYQDQSGGFAGYESFWGTVSSASSSDLTADPKKMTVHYAVDYTLRDGNHRTDDVTLHLVQRRGSYLISGAD